MAGALWTSSSRAANHPRVLTTQDRSISAASESLVRPHADSSPVGQVTKTVVLSNGTVVAGNFLPLNAAGLNDITYDSRNDQLYIVDALSDNISVLNGSTHTETASIAVGATPISATYDSANGYLYVENGLSDNISVIDGSTNAVVETITAGSYPESGAYDPTNGELYFADVGSSSVTVINAATNAIVGSVAAGCGSGEGPQSVAYDPLNGDVYVANYCSDNVTVIDGSTNSVVGSIGVGPGPYAIVVDPLNGLLYVANWGSFAPGNLTVIDGTAQKAVASIAVGEAPDALDFDNLTGDLFVANQISNNASIVSGATDSVIGSVNVGGAPDGVAYDSRTNEVYVINFYSDNATVLNGSTGAHITSISVGIDPDAVAYDSSNGDLYVACVGSNELLVLDGATAQVVAKIAVDSGPDAVAYDASTGDLYVAESLTDNLTVVDGATNSVVGSVSVGGYPWALAYDSSNGYIYAGNLRSNNVTVVNGTSERVVGSVSIVGPQALAYDGEDTDVYVASNGEDLSVVNGTTNSVVKVIPVGSSPFGIAYDPGNGYLYVANFASGNVTVVDGVSNGVVGSLDAGIAPDAAAYDGENGYIYVANLESNNLTVINGSSNTVAGSVAVGDGPTAVAFDGDPHVVATNGYSGSASVISRSARSSFRVTFTESGLPEGTEWFVRITDEPSQLSTGTMMTVSLPNGTYTYTIATADKRYEGSGGSFTVSGSGLSEPVMFRLQTYSVTFTEAGILAKKLAKNGWGVDLNGTAKSSFTTMISFPDEVNTTGMPVLVFAKGYDTTSSGTVTIKGTTGVSVAFVKGKVVTLTFHVVSTGKKGLKGATWCVAVDADQQCSSKSTIKYADLSPGTYSFSVLPVAGFTITATLGGTPIGLSGTLSVLTSTVVKLRYVDPPSLQALQGAPVQVVAAVVSENAPRETLGPLGAPGLAAVGLLGTALALRRRRA